MRTFRLVFATVIGLAAFQLPALADGTSVSVCNGGKAEFDAYLVVAGTTYTKHVKPIECVTLAQSDGQMKPASIGFAFTDPKGQYAGAKRLDRVPEWNSSLDAQFGLPVVLKAAHTTLTVKHGTASVAIPGLLSFQAQPQVCTQPTPTSSAVSQLPIGASMAQIRRAQYLDSLHGPDTSPQQVTCSYPSYALTAIAYPDTHEVALDEECYACDAAEQAKLTPEERAQQQEAQKSIDEGLRKLINTANFGGADGLRMTNMMDQTLKDDEAASARKAEMANGPYSMDWEHLSTFVTSAFSTAKTLMPNRHIILRGTVSKVVPPKQGAEIPRYVVYFKEGSTLTKPAENLPGDYFIMRYVGREDAFAICATDGAVLGDVFGAGYATTMVGKTVEMEGELNSGTCSAAVGIHVDLAHQLKVVTASTPLAKGQTFTPKFQTVSATAPVAPAAPAARAQVGAPAAPPPVPDANYVRDAMAARARIAANQQGGAQEPARTASVTPARAAAPAPGAPPAPPAPRRDPLIDQILNQMKQGGTEAAVLRALKARNRAVTLTDADKAELRAAGATDAVIAALLDPSTIPITPQEQQAATQRAAAQEAAQKLAACLQQAQKDHPTDRVANRNAQMACRNR